MSFSVTHCRPIRLYVLLKLFIIGIKNAKAPVSVRLLSGGPVSTQDGSLALGNADHLVSPVVRRPPRERQTWIPTMFIVIRMHDLHPAQKASTFRLKGSACVHTLVWPLPHRPVQLGWTCQKCETPTGIALGVIEARRPSHHFKVDAPGDGDLGSIAAFAVGLVLPVS